VGALAVRTALSAILLVATTVAAQADPSQYLCIAEQSAGLHYDKQTKVWGPQAFAAQSKYILRRLNDNDRENWPSLLKEHPNADWGFFSFGVNELMALCGSEFGLHCFWGDVLFEQDSLRFSRADYGAYLRQGSLETLRKKDPDEYNSRVNKYKMDPDQPDDLFIEIGKRSPL
jgi:hypothetical protein